MLEIFRNNCHSIPDYYKDLERISTQSDSDVVSTNLKNGDKSEFLAHTVKVGSLVIKTDNLSEEEIKEAEALGLRFKEIDDEIFDINMTLGLKYPDYAMRTQDTDAHKNIKKEQEVTLQQAREAVQAYDGLRTQLQARLDDAKLRAYSESSIPQGVRLEIQKQLEEKKKQQESDKSFEMPIAPEIEENPVIQMPEGISEEFDEGKAIFSQDEEGQTADGVPDSERVDLGKLDALFKNAFVADKSLQDEAAENDETEVFPTAAQVDEEEPSEVVNDCESQSEEGKEAFIQGNRKEYIKEELNEILSRFKTLDSTAYEEQSSSSISDSDVQEEEIKANRIYHVKETDTLNNDVKVNPQDKKAETEQPNENKTIKKFINAIVSKLNTIATIIKEIVKSAINIIKQYK